MSKIIDMIAMVLVDRICSNPLLLRKLRVALGEDDKDAVFTFLEEVDG